DLPQLHGDGCIELLVGARRRRAVGTPTLEPGRVPEAVTLEVLVRDLGDELDAHRLPTEVLARVPPALRSGPALPRRSSLGVGLGPVAPRMAVEGVDPVRLDLLEQLDACRSGEAAGHTDMVQHAR